MTARIDDSEVSGWLEENLPMWQLRTDRIYRRFETANWRVTLMTANAIGFLAEAAYHHPRLILDYRSVEVFLTTHDVRGVTKRDFDLALKIEETVRWPQEEGSTSANGPKEWL